MMGHKVVHLEVSRKDLHREKEGACLYTLCAWCVASRWAWVPRCCAFAAQRWTRAPSWRCCNMSNGAFFSHINRSIFPEACGSRKCFFLVLKTLCELPRASLKRDMLWTFSVCSCKRQVYGRKCVSDCLNPSSLVFPKVFHKLKIPRTRFACPFRRHRRHEYRGNRLFNIALMSNSGSFFCLRFQLDR